MKKILSIGLFVFLIFVIVLGFIMIKDRLVENKVNREESKLNVSVTLYPQYDFVRQIAKEKVNIDLILPLGMESHTYEPTPRDMKEILNADLFIYTGSEMEPWADVLINNMKDSENKIVDLSKNIELMGVEDLDVNHNEISETHNHEDHDYDPHIWLDPKNAMIMVQDILKQLIKVDPENQEYYLNNAKEYIDELNKLDTKLEEVISEAPKNKVVFGERFAFAYFVHRYDLEYISSYEGCSTESEPSAKRIYNVIEYIKENKIDKLLYEETLSTKIVDMLALETSSKKVQIHAIHNLSQSEFEKGVTYIELMYKNVDTLKEVLY